MKANWFGALATTLLLGLVVSAVQADDLWLVDFEAAKAKAAKEGKDILMEFTGSDWCPPCIALHDKVLTKDVFREKTPEKYVLLKLDTPKDKSKQTPAEIEQYKRLSSEYKITGVPTIILADAKGRPFAKNVGYSGAEADKYVGELLEKTKLRETRDDRLAKAEAAQGGEKAKLLGEAIGDIDSELAVATYRDVVDQIISLDADNAQGMKSKFEGLIKVGEVRSALNELRQTAGAAGPEELLKRIDDLMQRLEPTGEGLQEVLFLKANVLFRTDKAKSKETLLAAAKAAPASNMAKQIALIIERNFKDEPAAGEEGKKTEEKK